MSFGLKVGINFLVQMGCMALTACDRNGLYSALKIAKIAAGIDTLKVTLETYFDFLSGSGWRRWLACEILLSVTTTLLKVFTQFLKEINCNHFGSKSCFKASN